MPCPLAYAPHLLLHADTMAGLPCCLAAQVLDRAGQQILHCSRDRVRQLRFGGRADLESRTLKLTRVGLKPEQRRLRVQTRGVALGTLLVSLDACNPTLVMDP